MKSFAKIEQLAIELNLDFEYLYRIQVSKERINASIKKDLTLTITYKNISNKIYSIIQLDENDNVFDESITENDVILWGYDGWDDFWESNI